MLDSLPDHWYSVNRVRAKCRIEDSPLSAEDSSAKRGDSGDLVDVADGYLFVDFGKGTLMCLPEEVTPYVPPM